VRGSYFRFLLTQEFEECLKAIAPGQSIEIGIAEKYYAETCTVTIAEFDGVTDGRAWPAGIRETTKQGHAIRLPQGTAMPAATQTGIADLLGALGLDALRDATLATSGEMDLVLVSATGIAHFYAYDAGQKHVFGRSRLLKVATGSRLPDDYAVLAGKSVGIVDAARLAPSSPRCWRAPACGRSRSLTMTCCSPRTWCETNSAPQRPARTRPTRSAAASSRLPARLMSRCGASR
jgi:sulfur-carrier protein adenylyltransferase/sulfurtransferase